MKTKLLKIFVLCVFIIIYFFSIITTSQAQSISKLQPVHLIWISDGDKITLKKASEDGVFKPDSLTLEIYFEKSDIARINSENVRFEFRWFLYFSTKKQLMDSYIVDYNPNNFLPDNSYKISGTRKNLRKGFWEVQVIAKYDEGLLELSKISQFQILVK